MQHTKPVFRCALTSPWGAMTLAAHDTALVWVGFDGQKHAPNLNQWPVQHAHPLLQRACTQLRQYFSGQRHGFDLPLDFSKGTVFQQSVWEQLRNIAPGTTTTYGSIGQRIGKPGAGSGRAVGAAVGRNPISIIVPCHRVLGSDGAMTGYAGGLERKVALLQLERVL